MKVRNDVMDKLIHGLVQARFKAKQTGASIPKRWGYKTNRCTHWVYLDELYDRLSFNTLGYDGKRYHTEVKVVRKETRK